MGMGMEQQEQEEMVEKLINYMIENAKFNGKG
jgi:hypothetical protein